MSTETNNKRFLIHESAFRRPQARIGSYLLALAAGVVLMPIAAHAALDLTLSEASFPTATPFTATNPTSSNPVLDVNTSPETYGDFTYSNVVVKSTEATGYAQLTLHSATITNNDPNNAHTISLIISETDYSLPGGPGSTLSLTGTYSLDPEIFTSGNAMMTSYADAANDQFPSDPANAATTTSISTAVQSYTYNPQTGGGIGDGTGPTFFQRSNISPGDYSLAGSITININAGGTVDLSDNTFTFANAGVPDPTSLAIFAASGLLLMRRRRSGK